MKKPEFREIAPREWQARATMGWWRILRIDPDGDPRLYSVYHIMGADYEIDARDMPVAMTNTLQDAIDGCWKRMVDDYQLYTWIEPNPREPGDHT